MRVAASATSLAAAVPSGRLPSTPSFACSSNCFSSTATTATCSAVAITDTSSLINADASTATTATFQGPLRGF